MSLPLPKPASLWENKVYGITLCAGGDNGEIRWRALPLALLNPPLEALAQGTMRVADDPAV